MAFPEPIPGLVISYAYLWRDEARRGEESGRKDRPCVIVLSASGYGGEYRVLVAPVTHTRPRAGDSAIEMPRETKRRLGLDDAPSWIVLDDLNQFTWPGADLRPIGGGSGSFAYGFIPRSMLVAIRERVADLARAGRAEITTRTN